jgi:hypothetical protein
MVRGSTRFCLRAQHPQRLHALGPVIHPDTSNANLRVAASRPPTWRGRPALACRGHPARAPRARGPRCGRARARCPRHEEPPPSYA